MYILYVRTSEHKLVQIYTYVENLLKTNFGRKKKNKITASPKWPNDRQYCYYSQTNH